MTATFNLDGSVSLRDDANPTRVSTIPAGTSRADVDTRIAAFAGPGLPPDNPTLSDWRVGVLLWGRLDDVTKRVTDLIASGNPLGAVALQRLEFANNVLREQLMQLRGTFGFTEGDVDESLWRAERVRMGDLSGRWPVGGTQ
ncbi:hypothetical protein FHR71_001159 [Methylobacterium sp. RAS18]|nr:hypothetical protein [Methylobacterium sp. RAS18]